MTLTQLNQIMPMAGKHGPIFLMFINNAMIEFDINTRQRQASFLAQIAHESGELRYTREIASGLKYEGRKDLGNTQKGDGKRFCGRGLLQITGRAGYAACGAALGVDLLKSPERLEEPELATRSAAWFWKSHGCNELADAGNQIAVTRRINGGVNGWIDRLALFHAAAAALA